MDTLFQTWASSNSSPTFKINQKNYILWKGEQTYYVKVRYDPKKKQNSN